MEYLESQGWKDGDYLDKRQINDAAWEYYNQNKTKIRTELLKEINRLLSCSCERLTYVIPKQAVCILEVMLKDYPDHLELRTALANAKQQKYLRDFKISDDGTRLFSYLGDDTQIIIPSGIISICSGAFAECAEIEEVSFPASLGEIENRAFLNCTKLCKVTVNGSVPVIAENAFLGCINLSDAPGFILSMEHCTLPDGEIDTEHGLFRYQKPGVLSDYTEKKGTSSYVLSIPSGTYRIDSRYLNCGAQAEEVFFPDTVENLDGVRFSKKLRNCHLPKSLTAVPHNLFWRNETIKAITLPDRVVIIEKEAFYECKSLTSIYMPTDLTYICESAFENCSSLESVKFSESLKSIENRAFFGCKKIKSVEIPDSVTECAKEAFRSCTNLETVRIGNGLKQISSALFQACGKLKTVILSNSVEEICKNAFSKCKKLTKIEMPAAMHSLEANAFEDCIGLETIVLHSPLSKVEPSAMKGCTALKTIQLAGKEIAVSSPEEAVDALLGKVIVKQAPVCAMRIENNILLAGPHNESDIVIPDEIVGIAKDAFAECNHIVSLQIGLGLTDITAELFQIPSLQKITAADNHPCYISRDGVLFSKDSKTLICYPPAKPDNAYTVPDGTESLGAWAFANCQNLKTLIMPQDIDTITIHENTFFQSISIESFCFLYPACFGGNFLLIARSTSSGYPFKGCKVKSLLYSGEYGCFEVPCTAGKLVEKQQQVQRGFQLLENHNYEQFFEADPWRSAIDTNIMLPLLAAYFAVTKDQTALPYVTENLPKLMQKAIANGDAAFVKAVLETGSLLSEKDISKFAKAADKAGYSDLKRLFEQASETV